MAEVWRNKGETPDTSTRIAANENKIESGVGALPEKPLALPATAAPASNPAWNRSAEMVGRSVGTAVSEVRRLPRRLDDLKSKIHLVGKDAGVSLSGVRSSAETKAAELTDAAEIGLLELADKAAVYTSEIGCRASHRLDDFRREAWWKLAAMRTIVRHRVAGLRRWSPEQPLQVIVVSASAAFALGVLLRIRGANRD